MVTLNRIPQNGSTAAQGTAAVGREAYETVETFHQIPDTIEELVGKPEPVENESPPHKLAGLVLGFYDWLSGMPMTQRDRIQREIAEAHPHFSGIFGAV